MAANTTIADIFGLFAFASGSGTREQVLAWCRELMEVQALRDTARLAQLTDAVGCWCPTFQQDPHAAHNKAVAVTLYQALNGLLANVLAYEARQASQAEAVALAALAELQLAGLDVLDDIAAVDSVYDNAAAWSRCPDKFRAQLAAYAEYWGVPVAAAAGLAAADLRAQLAAAAQAFTAAAVAAQPAPGRGAVATPIRTGQALRQAGHIVDWLAVALFGLLLAVFCCLRAAGAAEFTFTGTDTRTGQAVEVLDPRYQCAANRAADAGARAGIDCCWTAGELARGAQ